MPRGSLTLSGFLWHRRENMAGRRRDRHFRGSRDSIHHGRRHTASERGTFMDIDTGAGPGADRGRPVRSDRRGLRAIVAVATVAAITAAAGALVLGGQAAAGASTLKAGAETDTRYFG